MAPVKPTSETYPVLVSGYYGFDNLGDEAILQSIIQWFEKRNDVHPVVLSANPRATFDAYGVDSIPRANLGRIFRRIFQCPVLIQGGGGLYQDVTSSRSLYYYLGILLLGLITGRKNISFAVGIGPLEGELSPLFTGEFLSQMDLVCVRDFKSYTFAQSRMPVNAPLKIMADAALVLEPSDPDLVEDIFLKENLDVLGRPLIAWSVKGSIKDNRQIIALARAIDMVNGSLGGGSVIVPFHHPWDFQYAEAVRGMCSDRDSVFILKERYRPSEILGLIGKCDIVVGMRLHSLIFSANRDVPFVPVSYDPKIDEFAGEFGMKPAAHVPLVGPERLSEAIEETFENKNRIKAKISQTATRLRGRTTDGFRALDEFFDSLELGRMRIRGTVRKREGRAERKSRE
ncbi:MAG: polysaccharide pyruvyl transferase CsaB [bacterium]